ncbi:MAG: hypothetical protein WBG08_07890 [Litorimonas sp.]
MTSIRTACAALLAATTLSAPAPAQDLAQGQDPSCVTRAEAQAVVAYLMPDLVRRVGEQCRGALGPAAYLSMQGEALATEMTPLAEQSGPEALGVLEQFTGTPLPDNDFLLELGRLAIADGIAKELDAPTCGRVDRLVEALAPLPPRNRVDVFALVLEVGVNDDPGSAVKVCPAP